jgi:hypothetical protein
MTFQRARPLDLEAQTVYQRVPKVEDYELDVRNDSNMDSEPETGYDRVALLTPASTQASSEGAVEAANNTVSDNINEANTAPAIETPPSTSPTENQSHIECSCSKCTAAAKTSTTKCTDEEAVWVVWFGANLFIIIPWSWSVHGFPASWTFVVLYQAIIATVIVKTRSDKAKKEKEKGAKDDKGNAVQAIGIIASGSGLWFLSWIARFLELV